MRKFEKISYDEFCKIFGDNKELYDNIILPTRSTKNSAGYDIRSLDEIVIKPNDSKVIRTGIKCSMNSDEVLLIFDRSSLGFKYDVFLSNNVGVIDSDYYNNSDNEGHICIKLINLGTSDFVINVNDRIAQGIFIKYLTTDNEVEIKNERNGGFGSTNNKEMN